jgi:hypothetical protein
MEQRPLRLGDVVDDYCPRERRVTNHAIVAIVEDVIRQTRCTTCDTEHPFKGAREPRLRRKPGTAALYDQVLADVTGAPAPEARPESSAEASMAAAPETKAPLDDGAADSRPDAEMRPDDEAPEPSAEDPPAAAWIMHRPLIRATLPRTENDQPPPRPIPEFTMHQRQTRGSRAFRFSGHGNGNSNGNANGNVNGNTGGRHGHGFGGPGGNNRQGKHSGRRHRGGKRPR